jgi:hypothetical protein
MPFEAAAQMERDLAEDLRADGYTVTGGTEGDNSANTKPNMKYAKFQN